MSISLPTLSLSTHIDRSIAKCESWIQTHFHEHWNAVHDTLEEFKINPRPMQLIKGTTLSSHVPNLVI